MTRTSKVRFRASDTLASTLKEQNRKRRDCVAASRAVSSRNDLTPRLQLVDRSPSNLVLPKRNVRRTTTTHVGAVMRAITVTGYLDPVLIDADDNVLDGVIRVEAARALNLASISCVRATHLTAIEKRVVRLALNRLSEKGQWSLPELKCELLELSALEIEIPDTGFELSEFDQIVLDDPRIIENGPHVPAANAVAVAQPGDVFVFRNGHRIICGDATKEETYQALMKDSSVRLVVTDEPYNVPIIGHVTNGSHREFVMASGEMSSSEFLVFNSDWMAAAIEWLCDGGLFGTFIDWRGYPTVHSAATAIGLSPINLIVWSKSNAGLGSLYRSQHELLPIYKKGTAAHVNNIRLGRNGRWRSNLWSYPGASSIASDSRRGLQFHPTVKPVVMLEDMILDLTNREEAVLDPFLGSGSTLIAAERTGRHCFGIELDPLYVDLAITRYRNNFGELAQLESTGETFDQVRERRGEENALL